MNSQGRIWRIEDISLDSKRNWRSKRRIRCNRHIFKPHAFLPNPPMASTHLLQQVLLQRLDLLLGVQTVPEHAGVHTVVILRHTEARG